jgi:hypothetical protein
MGYVLVTRIDGHWIGNRPNLVNLGFFLKQTFMRSAAFDIIGSDLPFAANVMKVGNARTSNPRNGCTRTY